MIRFPIEASHVMMFARALGDPSPAWQEPLALAPPTFAIAADHFDPDFERRPRSGEPWFGSGREAVSVLGGSQQAPEGASGFHAEERFVYHRPLRVGDALLASKREGGSYAREGRRGGALRFQEHVTDFRDETGEPVVSLTWVDVLTERAVEPGKREHRKEEEDKQAHALLDTGDGRLRVGGRMLEVGAVHKQVVVDDLRRTQIVQYAGASGDFHPMHTDTPYAKAMGAKAMGAKAMGPGAAGPEGTGRGVFAHGMLTMGLAGVALTNVVEPSSLADYSARFRGIVWPGDTLTARVTLAGRVERASESLARFDLEARNQTGEIVLTGRAHAHTVV